MNEKHLPIERLIDYLHGELAPAADASVLAHLEACATCRTAYDAEAELSDLLHTYARSTERDLPPGLLARIRASVEDASHLAWRQRLTLWLRPLVALPLGAAAVIAVYFIALALHFGAPQRVTIAAAYYLEDHAALTRTMPFGANEPVVPASLESGDPGGDQLWVATTGSASNATP